MPSSILPGRRDRCRLRRTLTLVGLAAVFTAFAAGRATAQETRIPDVVLAKVLGRVPPEAQRASGPASAPEVELVAQRMQRSFEDQLVAGIHRPEVELRVHFAWDSAEIDERSTAEIEATARLLHDHFPATRFRLAGFADPSGAPDYNQRLSERRADAVRRVLVDRHGVPDERLEAVGYGERDPSDPASDAERRRVELQLLRDETVGGRAEACVM